MNPWFPGNNFTFILPTITVRHTFKLIVWTLNTKHIKRAQNTEKSTAHTPHTPHLAPLAIKGSFARVKGETENENIWSVCSSVCLCVRLTCCAMGAMMNCGFKSIFPRLAKTDRTRYILRSTLRSHFIPFVIVCVYMCVCFTLSLLICLFALFFIVRLNQWWVVEYAFPPTFPRKKRTHSWIFLLLCLRLHSPRYGFFYASIFSIDLFPLCTRHTWMLHISTNGNSALFSPSSELSRSLDVCVCAYIYLCTSTSCVYII